MAGGLAKLKSFVLRSLLGVVALAGTIVLGLAGWSWTSLPTVSGTVDLPGLRAPVEVLRDGNGIPRIHAESPEDAWFALGFVHAQDRLWQMETMRRLGAGRLAEVVGPAALPHDRFMRVLGLYRAAERQLDTLAPETRRALERYAEGVNAWLDHRFWALPPEFVFLFHTPERWKPADSLVWGKLMALELGGRWHEELLRARLLERLTPAQVDQLWPGVPADAPATLGLPAGLDVKGLLAAAGGTAGPSGASNAWVVAGRRADGGKPILANDPHLGFSAPILWYLVTLDAPGLSVSGATVPGVPFVVLGHTERAAWGMTSTEADLIDLFLEKLDPDAPLQRYLTPDGPAGFTARDETIDVRFGAREVLRVRETRHGPVLSDVSSGAAAVAGTGYAVAFAATFLRGDDKTPDALLRLNRMQGRGDFTAAMADFQAPQQNVFYADVDGHFGLAVPGRVPLRRGGPSPLPRHGWTGDGDWTGFVAIDDRPVVIDPDVDWLVDANNRPVPAGSPLAPGSEGDMPYRAQRIEALLAASPLQTPDTTAEIQLDHVSPLARDLLPVMLAGTPRTEDARQVLGLLERWNGSMSRRRPEPLIFNAWLRELHRALIADDLGDLFPEAFRYRPRFVKEALTEHTEWCDDISTPEVEDCGSVLVRSLETAFRSLHHQFGAAFVRWRWGDLHRARFDHPLVARLPVLSHLGSLEIDTDGGAQTVNRGDMRIGDPDHPFAHVHGPGLRAIYPLDDVSRARFMIATGQSGNPWSGHYGDLLEPWRDGSYLRLDLPRDDLEKNAEGVLTLAPR